MATVKPIFRMFDYDKTIAFYVDWLGFKVNWEHREGDSPLYMEVALDDIVLHLSEHHGDCCPGARLHIEDFRGLEAYHKQIMAKDYKYNRPGLDKAFRRPKSLCMEVIDPAGNRLTFNETL